MSTVLLCAPVAFRLLCTPVAFGRLPTASLFLSSLLSVEALGLLWSRLLFFLALLFLAGLGTG